MRRNVLACAVFAALFCTCAAYAQSTHPVTYQGVLTQSGAPLTDGDYDLTFKIYNASTSGTLIETILVEDVSLVNGRFAAIVPVSATTITGADRWWSVTVNFTELPRQKITFAPCAMTAASGPTSMPFKAAQVEARADLYGLTSTAGAHFYLKDTTDRVDLQINYKSTGVTEDLLFPLRVVTPSGVPFSVDARGYVTAKVLTILGADMAEKFDIAARSNTPEPIPGMVVSIDPDHPGQLQLASTAYDTKVAGVISGANGLSVGMILGSGNPAPTIDGKHPVAMTGRVWVFADESNGEIAPGDRLTTSAIKTGYAMKATDNSKAPGSVIGKVMTKVDPATGMVLVLVNLQ